MLKVKNHSNFGKHIKSLLLACAVLSVAFFFVLRFNSGINEASAQATPGSMTGWAWSDNIGWIDFAPAGGGVQVDASGNITGYAWSDNVGWLKFGGLSGFPSGTGTLSSNAKITGSTLVGWARFCAGTVSGTCANMTSRTDGWDGWVSLSGSTYGATYNSSTGAIGGYAWGSDVVGWIEFRANVPVATFSYSVSGGSAVSMTQGSQYIVSASVNPNNRISVSRTSGAGTFGSVTLTPTVTKGGVANTGITVSNIGPTPCAVNDTNPSCQSTYTLNATASASGTYRVTFTSGTQTTGFDVTVSAPNAPTVTCNVSPSSVTTGQSVTWTASASGGAGTGAYTYSWSGSDSLSGNTANVSKTYSTAGTKSATVTATRAGVSGSCSNTVVVNSSALTYTVSGGNPIAMNSGSQYIVSASVNPNNRISVSRTSGVGTSGSVTLTPTVTKGGVANTDITVSNIGPTPCALNDTNPSCQSTYTLNATASASGTYRVTFSAGAQSTWFDVTVSSLSAPTVTCNVSPSSVTTGQSVTWTASASGGAGTGAYTYSWSGTDSLSGSGVTATKTYSTAGTKSATVTATRGGVSGTCTSSVVVNNPTPPGNTVFWFSGDTEFSVLPGETKQVPIYVYKDAGLTSTVVYTITRPSQVTSMVGSLPQPNGSVYMSFTIGSNVPLGSRVSVPMSGSANGVTRYHTINFNVVSPTTPPPTTPFDYDLTGGTDVITLYTGQTATGNLTATHAQGPTGTATVSAVSSGSTSVVASISPSSCSVVVGSSCLIGYTITVPYNATPSTYTVTFTGTGGPSQKTKTINVTVLARSLSCLATPTQPTVGSTVTWTANPTPSDPTYSYVWTGAPNIGTTQQVASRVVSAPGVYTGNVDVKLDGNSIGTASCSVTVLPGGSGEF